jgi:hypothetical protein
VGRLVELKVRELRLREVELRRREDAGVQDVKSKAMARAKRLYALALAMEANGKVLEADLTAFLALW